MGIIKGLTLVTGVQGEGSSMGQLVLAYIQTFIWPAVVIFALLKYRKVIESLISPSEVTLSFFGMAIKIPLKPLIQALEETIPIAITDEQWNWLRRLYEGRQSCGPDDYSVLLDLRNAGLIRAYPGKRLIETKQVEITPLGKILFEAREKGKT